MRKCCVLARVRLTLLAGSSMSPNCMAPAMQELTQAGVTSGSLPRHLSGNRRRVDPILAELALHRHRDAAGIETRRLRGDRLLAVGEMRRLHDRARVIWAGHDAVGAADADVVVDRHQPVCALLGRRRRANRFARRIRAMHARRPARTLRCTSGNSPTSTSSTRRHCTPGGVALALLQAAVQVWQPTQRRRSIDHDVARHAAILRYAAQRHTHEIGPGTGGVDQIERHRRDGVQARHVEILGVRRRPVIELPDDDQRVRPHALRQRRLAVGRADLRANLDPITFGDAVAPGGRRVHDDAGAAANVLGHFAHQLDPDIAAGVVLHALAREQPEREILELRAGFDERPLPVRWHVVPFRQRRVFGQLLVPPVHILLMQPVPQFAADAQQTLLIGQLVTQSLLLHGRASGTTRAATSGHG